MYAVIITVPTYQRPRLSPPPPPMPWVTTSVQGLRQPSGSSSPTSYSATAPPHVTCTASSAAGFAAYIFVLVQYDFAAGVGVYVLYAMSRIEIDLVSFLVL
jgi:hypothetical protein